MINSDSIHSRPAPRHVNPRRDSPPPSTPTSDGAAPCRAGQTLRETRATSRPPVVVAATTAATARRWPPRLRRQHQQRYRHGRGRHCQGYERRGRSGHPPRRKPRPRRHSTAAGRCRCRCRTPPQPAGSPTAAAAVSVGVAPRHRRGWRPPLRSPPPWTPPCACRWHSQRGRQRRQTRPCPPPRTRLDGMARPPACAAATAAPPRAMAPAWSVPWSGRPRQASP